MKNKILFQCQKCGSVDICFELVSQNEYNLEVNAICDICSNNENVVVCKDKYNEVNNG